MRNRQGLTENGMQKWEQQQNNDRGPNIDTQHCAATTHTNIHIYIDTGGFL